MATKVKWQRLNEGAAAENLWFNPDKRPIQGEWEPTSVTPEYIGQQYVDTTENKMYFATWTEEGNWEAVWAGGGDMSEYQEKRYKTDTRLDPSAMWDLWASPIVLKSQERDRDAQWYNSYYEAKFEVWSSIITLYETVDEVTTQVHSFDAWFAPKWWYCAWQSCPIYMTAAVKNAWASERILVLWNEEHLAIFIAPKTNVLHFSTENRLYASNKANVDWTIPQYSQFDISSFNPADFEGSQSISFLWTSKKNLTFNPLILSDNWNFYNLANWTDIDSMMEWISPDPNTALTASNLTPVYIDGIANVSYEPIASNQYSCAWVVVRHETEYTIIKVSLSSWMPIDSVLAETWIDLWESTYIWTFTSEWWTAGWELWWPADPSKYYLWYWASSLFLAADDQTVLKTSNLIWDISTDCDATQTYQWSVIKGIANNMPKPIEDIKYSYKTDVFPSVVSDNYDLTNFVYFKWPREQPGYAWVQYYCFRQSLNDENRYLCQMQVENGENGYTFWSSTVYDNWNPVVISDITGQSTVTQITVSEDWTKIACITANNSYFVYTMSTPWDYTTIAQPQSWIMLWNVINSVNVWYNIWGEWIWISPDWKYLYVSAENSYNTFNVFEITTPFTISVSSVTWIRSMALERWSSWTATWAWFSPDWKYIEYFGSVYKTESKYLLQENYCPVSLSYSTIMDHTDSYNLTPTTPMPEFMIFGRTAININNPKNVVPSWSWAINAVSEAFDAKEDTTSTSVLEISSLTTIFEPTQNFTLKCWMVKPWMSYVLRLNTGTAYTITLDSSVTNPYNESLTLTSNKTTTIILLATSDWTLEIQWVKTAA